METAINLAQDGKPLFGESVVILGQGIVGLLLSELMSQFPLASLVSFEKDRDRCDWSKLAGVNNQLDEGNNRNYDEIKERI